MNNRARPVVQLGLLRSRSDHRRLHFRCHQSSHHTSPPPSTTSTTGARVVNATAPVPVKTDGITVTDDAIYLGLLADVTGPFSGTVIDVLDAQVAFWSK